MPKQKTTTGAPSLIYDDGNIIDAETGELLDREAAEKHLLFLEQQISLGCIQIALALKVIRDNHFYLLRGFNSMKDYIEQSLTMSEVHAKRYLLIADSFSDMALQKLSNANLTSLIAIAKNEDLLEEAHTENPDTNELIRKARERERKKVKTELEGKEARIDQQDEQIHHLRERIDEKDAEIDKLRHTVQELAIKREIDPAEFVFVTQKKEAIATVQAVYHITAQKLSLLQRIPHELMDAELSAQLAHALSALKTALYNVENTFFVQLTKANDNIGILPE